LTQNKANLCKILIVTLVFEKNANFFAENWRKSQKIDIITTTPGLSDCSKYNRQKTGKLYQRLRLLINSDKKWVGIDLTYHAIFFLNSSGHLGFLLILSLGVPSAGGQR
jgi:hypothetical protein